MAIPTDIDGTWTNSGGSLDAGELRRADAAMFAGIGSALGVGGGVTRHGDTSMSVTVDGSDVVTVQPGAVLIPGNAVAGTGCYRFGLSAAITGALAARNATNPRITLVIARYLDDDVVGTHDAYKGRIEFVNGTPAGVPAVPTLPSMAVELARITVPQTGGGAATVDLTHRTYATSAGGEIVVPTASMLPASAATYQRAVALDTGVKYRWDGAAWDDGTWLTWTPTLTGITIGTGSVVARYRVLDNKTVVGTVKILGNTGTSFSGTMLITLPPVAIKSTYDIESLGLGHISNNSAASRNLFVVLPNSGLTQFVLAAAAGTVTATFPITLTTAARIGFEFKYEAA